VAAPPPTPTPTPTPTKQDEESATKSENVVESASNEIVDAKDEDTEEAPAEEGASIVDAKDEVTEEAPAEEGASIVDAKDEVTKEAPAEEGASPKPESADVGQTQKAAPSKETGSAPRKDQAKEDKKKAAAAASAANAFDDAGRTTQKMGGSFEAVAVQYQQEKLKYFKLIEESLAKEREAVADIAKFARLLTSAEADGLALDQAVSGLYQAIGALKRVASILADASLFWKSMARHCKQLAQSDLKSVIDDYTDAYEDADERIAEYLTPKFKEDTVRFLASWKALEVICREYREKTETIKVEILESYERELETKDALKRAVALGSEVLTETDEETRRLAEDARLIDEQKAAAKTELDEFRQAS
jgi:hypothetical protein